MANATYTGTICGGSSTTFVSNEGLLTGKTYQDFDLTCITINTSASTSNEITKTFLYGPFNSCSGCTAPIQAGAAYTTCKECNVSGNTTTTTISQPHAIYTNQFGKAVEQMGSVVLGGINGLNN